MAVVRIDDKLLEKIKEYLRNTDNKYQYPSISSFVNNVVYERLNNIKKKR